VKAVSSDKSEQQSKELLEAKGDILRLRAQMRRVEGERTFARLQDFRRLVIDYERTTRHSRFTLRMAAISWMLNVAGRSGY
jgi:hypothetical protein